VRVGALAVVAVVATVALLALTLAAPLLPGSELVTALQDGGR
jgi:hypothetical protein